MLRTFLTTLVAMTLLTGPSSAEGDYSGITIKRGYPLPADGERLIENLKLNRAIELFLWSLPVNQSYAGRDGVRAASGGGDLDINYIGDFSDHRVGLSTLNNETIYVIVHLDLSDGPVVYEQPVMDAKGYMFGSIVDIWQVAMTDVGVPPVAPDMGKGGKYLILPPGYEGDVPSGYFVIESTSNLVTLGLRSVMLGDATADDAIARARSIKVYHHFEPERAQVYTDIADTVIPAEIDTGVGAFRRMHAYINSEPIRESDLYMVGMLQSIGIEKGKPFPEDDASLALYQRAAELGWMTAKQNTTFSWEPGLFGGWLAVGLPDTWTPDYTAENAILVDRRAAYFTLGIWPPRNMGTSTFYTIAFRDANDAPLMTGGNYKMTLPPDVPVASFWSVILYDAERFTMIENPYGKYTVNSLNENLAINADGSVDVYFGPDAPDGLEENWIPTTENDFFVGVRFYAPDMNRLGKTWALERPASID
ncbi:MAG: DUF1214 domain-containing protein [Dinoroseobacter sp.]|nr:DUF1214 domain-containing protein [Dinoroseobacter sp.]